MAANDVWELIASFADGRELGECVFHQKLGTEVTTGANETAEALLAKFDTILAELATAIMTDTTYLIATAAHRVKGANGTTRYYTHYPNAVGGITSEHVGAQRALLVSKYTATNTRSGRGRSYIPFLSSTLETSGRIDSSDMITISAACDDLFEVENTDTENNVWKPVVYSRKLDLSYEIDDMVVRPVLCTQRRRVVHKQGVVS